MRAFWVREYKNRWSSTLDGLPARWYDEPIAKGPFEGATLDRAKYEAVLRLHYQKRGWDSRGIPKTKTLTNLGLRNVAQELSQHVKLTA